MNMPSAIPPPSRLCAEVVVLVDGENISSQYADDIRKQAEKYGEVVIHRVYGSESSLKQWCQQSGFSVVTTPVGKNSADMKLAVDAMGFAYSRPVECFVVASSDTDFTHLADALIDCGIVVIGMGEDKTARRFRKTCTGFVRLGAAAKPEIEPASAKPKSKTLIARVIQLIEREGSSKGMRISQLGARMHSKHGIRVSQIVGNSWRRFLTTRPQLFVCDAKGPNARVRLKKGKALLGRTG